jgi:general secretion pathway protein A
VFLEYYNLREQPFGVTPDPRFLYFGPSHREAFASLLYAIETKRGFSAMVAEPGMGKTSLLFRMLESVSGTARAAFLFQTGENPRDILVALLHDLRIETTNLDLVGMHEALNQALLQEMHAGRQVIAVIDEAQNLDEKALEFIRLLSNFETPTQKLMHIVLAGQPLLAQKFADGRLEQLRQRVSTIIHLEPLNQHETAEYIEHRLRAAGHVGLPIFSSDALEIIAQVSRGIPRNINSVCFSALSIGFASQTKTIGARILREAVEDFSFDKRGVSRTSTVASGVSVPSDDEIPTFVQKRLKPTPPGPKEPSVGRRLTAAFACLAIPLLSIIGLSEPQLGLSRTLPGRVSQELVNAVFHSLDAKLHLVPALPDSLKPPAPPVDMMSDEPASPAGEQASSVKAGDHTDTSSGQQSRVLAANRISETGTLAQADRMEAEGAQESATQRSDVAERWSVQVPHAETLLQFALEHYGKAEWGIIEQICRMNPQIHGPYDILSAGQWIELAGEPADTAVQSDGETNADSTAH